MLVRNKDRSYTTHKKRITGKGFIDSLSSTLKNVGSYIYQNKDLIAKPMLGAIGNVGALGLTEAAKLILTRLAQKNSNKSVKKDDKLTRKEQEIVEAIYKQSSENSLPNIIGSGIKKF